MTDRPRIVKFSSGDWDFGSSTLADEVADLDPGRYVGERVHIDEVEDESTLLAIHVYEWDGDAWERVGRLLPTVEEPNRD